MLVCKGGTIRKRTGSPASIRAAEPAVRCPNAGRREVLFGTNLTRLVRRSQLAHYCPSALNLHKFSQLHPEILVQMRLLSSLAFACMTFWRCPTHKRDANRHGWIHGHASHGFTSSHRFPTNKITVERHLNLQPCTAGPPFSSPPWQAPACCWLPNPLSCPRPL